MGNPGIAWLQDAARDLRYGARGLLRTPGFAAVAVLTLALGIGANTAIFSILYAVLLAPPPYPAGSRLVDISMKELTGHRFERGVSYPDLEDWKRQTQLFATFATHQYRRELNVTGAGEAEEINGDAVSSNLFPSLGVAPMLGRGFTAGEDSFNGPRSILISYGYYQRRFGGKPSAIGRRLDIDGDFYTIAGVMPPRFEFPLFGGDYSPALWLSLNLSPDRVQQRDARSLSVVGLLKPGVTPRQAQSEMETIVARLASAYPKENSGYGVKVSPLEENRVTAAVRPAFLLLMAAAAFVLLIACVNLANLLLARNAARDRELAVRRALGATRLRLLRQFLAETWLLALAGGAAGVLLAWLTLPLLKTLLPANTPRINEVSVNWAVLAAAAAASLGTGLLFGLLPAWRATTAITSRHSARQRPARILVTAEVALALVLLAAAGLLIESFRRASEVDMGFERHNVLTMRMQLSRNRYPTAHSILTFHDELLRRAGSVPGVIQAGTVNMLPLGIIMGGIDYETEQRQEWASFASVSPGYLRAIGIPLVYGRYFDRTDRRGTAPVTVVSASVARRYWRGVEAIGRRIRFDGQWFTIVGVVKDVRQNNLEAPPEAGIYALVSQLSEKRQNGISGRFIVLVLRTTTEAAATAAAMRAAVAAIDKDQPVTDVKTMEQHMQRALSGRRLNTLLLSIFAALAIALAAVGVFGVVSYAVARRTSEIGIRMALGAPPETILAMVVRETLVPGLTGVALGVAGTVAMSRVLSRFLFGVAPTQPGIMAGVAALLVTVVVASALGPARRAMRVDPAVSLRD